MFTNSTTDSKKIYLPILIYAVESFTTTFGCLAEVLSYDELTFSEKANLGALYAPIILVALIMGIDMGQRINSLIPKKTLKIVKKKTH